MNGLRDAAVRLTYGLSSFADAFPVAYAVGSSSAEPAALRLPLCPLSMARRVPPRSTEVALRGRCCGFPPSQG